MLAMHRELIHKIKACKGEDFDRHFNTDFIDDHPPKNWCVSFKPYHKEVTLLGSLEETSGNV